MIKKVVISAAGQGTRMLDLTKDKSKHLINVENKPFLAYLLDNILEAGYQEIIIVVGYREEMIREFLKTYTFKGLVPDIKIVNQIEILGPKEKEYGTACPLKCVKDLVGNESFLSVVGDNFYSVEDLKAMNVDDKYTYVGGIFHDTPEKFGVLVGDNGFLREIVEKPKSFVGNLVNTSLYKFTPALFEKLSQIKKSPRGEYEITDVISLLAQENIVKVKKMNGYWMDFGKPEDVEKFSSFVNGNYKTISQSS